MVSSEIKCAGPMGRREVVRGHARQRVKPSLKFYSLATDLDKYSIFDIPRMKAQPRLAVSLSIFSSEY
eukprot:scaffold24408_cov101-Isochrysis_galbana.AAC.2